MAVNVQETRLGIVPSKNVQKIVNGVPGMNVVPHVDQENKAEQFWLKPQMEGNALVTRLRIVTSQNALFLVNGMNGVNVVHPVDQENKPGSSLVEKSVLKLRLSIATSKIVHLSNQVVYGVNGVIAIQPVDQEKKPESNLVEKSVLKR